MRLLVVKGVDDATHPSIEGSDAAIAGLNHGKKVVPIRGQVATCFIGIKRAEVLGLAPLFERTGLVKGSDDEATCRRSHDDKRVQLEHTPESTGIGGACEDEELVAKGQENRQAKEALGDVCLIDASFIEPEGCLLAGACLALLCPPRQRRMLGLSGVTPRTA